MTPEEYDQARLRAGLTHRQIAETILDIAERTWHGRIQRARACGGPIKLSRLEAAALCAALSSQTATDGESVAPLPRTPRTLEQLAADVALLERGQAEVFRELGELRTLLGLQADEPAPRKVRSKRTGRTDRPDPQSGTGL